MGQLPGKEKSAEDASTTLVDGGNLVPHGVYSAAQDYSHQVVRHLITHRRLAPFYKGVDDEDQYKDAVANTECPICFLYQPSPLNMSRCCEQPICTECFVQIKRADPTHTNPPSSEPAACPFCMTEDFGVIYVPPKPKPVASGDGSEMPTGPVPARRRKSFGPTDPEVVTIDMIRPDWTQKLQHAQAAIARRANRRIIMRQVGDRLIPIGVTSGRAAEMLEQMGSGAPGGGSSGPGGAIILQENERWLSTSQRAALAAQAALQGGEGVSTSAAEPPASGGNRREGSGGGNNGSSSDDRRRERRRHNQDLSEYLRTLGGGPDMEEIMLMEAMRLSLLEHEEEERKRATASAKSGGGDTVQASDSVGSSAAPATTTASHANSSSSHPPPPVPEPIPVPSPAPIPAALPGLNTRTDIPRSSPTTSSDIAGSGGADQSRALEEAMQDLMSSPATAAAATIAISPATATASARPSALLDSQGGDTPTQSTYRVPQATVQTSSSTSALAGSSTRPASAPYSANPVSSSPASSIPPYPSSPSESAPSSTASSKGPGGAAPLLSVPSPGDAQTSPWVSFQDDSGIPPTPVSERNVEGMVSQDREAS